MRIVYVSSADLEIQEYKFLKKIVDSGHELYIITHYSEEEIPKNVAALEGVKILCYDNQIAFSKGVDQYSIFTRKIRCWLAFIKSYFRFMSDIKKIKPDIIHAGWVQGDGFLAAISNFRPIVLMPWASDILIDPDKNIRLMLKTKFVLSKVDYIIPDCEAMKTKILELSNFDSSKIVVFPWGINLNLFKPAKKENPIKSSLGWEHKRILIMTRFFYPGYGIEYFIDALPEIIKSDPDIRVLLLATGPLEPVIREMVSDLGLSQYIHFAGVVSSEKMAEYLNSADIYVSSSLTDGTSVSLIEAMACELPVVVSDIPSNNEWIKDGENGYLVPTRNSHVLAARIINLLENDELREKMGKENLSIAHERADWDKNYDKLEQIYATLFLEKQHSGRKNHGALKNV